MYVVCVLHILRRKYWTFRHIYQSTVIVLSVKKNSFPFFPPSPCIEATFSEISFYFALFNNYSFETKFNFRITHPFYASKIKLSQGLEGKKTNKKLSRVSHQTLSNLFQDLALPIGWFRGRLPPLKLHEDQISKGQIQRLKNMGIHCYEEVRDLLSVKK